MKHIFALIAVLLIAGCAAEPEADEQVPEAPELPEIPEGFECSADEHCATGGSSGEVCQAKS